MNRTNLGPLTGVSRLALGGGGLGNLWGATEHDEAVATVRAAVDGGINLIDLAPLYGNSEALVAEAFGGRPPKGIRFTSKCYLGSPEAPADGLIQSLETSLATLGLEQLDVFFLHTNICPDDYVYAQMTDLQHRFSTTWSIYTDHVVPTMERLRAQGRIGAWGITAVGIPQTIAVALERSPAPQVAQVVTNLLDSAGGMRRFADPFHPRETLALAKARGIGVMGIRAVQAGALCAAFDREVGAETPEGLDYAVAAPFRALCNTWGVDPALAAHRYALSLEGVDTLVLGVKNRAELRQGLEAERHGPLSPDQVVAIDQLGLRSSALDRTSA